MSKITLEFYEYQELRDNMAFARGVLSVGPRDDGRSEAVRRLEDAGGTLESARWRDPNWNEPKPSLWQQLLERIGL